MGPQLPQTGRKRGRPKQHYLTANRRQLILDSVAMGATLDLVQKRLGISPTTWYRWMDQKPDFEQEVLIARGKYEQSIIEKAHELAMAGSEKMLMFLMERTMGYRKVESHEHVFRTRPDDEMQPGQMVPGGAMPDRILIEFDDPDPNLEIPMLEGDVTPYIEQDEPEIIDLE